MFIRTRPEKGSLVLGTYKVMATIAEDSIYQWLKAGSTTDGNSVVLQIPQSSISQDESNLLFDYFETLQYFKDKKGFIVPDIQTDSDYPLVLIYSNWPEEILLDALRRTPKNAEKWWKAASEALHALHNKNLVHGHLNPDSFVVAEEQVYIRGFGYTPLLELGHKDAIKECGKFLAPEVVDKCDINRIIDVYAFAKTVACWKPTLEPTSWYCQATEVDPKERLGKMREVFDELKKLLNETNIDAPAPKNSSGKGGSILVPKHTLTVTAEPSMGGGVKGGGHYQDSERVTVTAVAKRGWQFERWSGAISGSDNPVTLTLSDDKTIVAHFTDLAALIPLEIEPPPTTIASRTTTRGTKERKSPVTFNTIKWLAVLGLVLGGVAVFNALSPHSERLCRPLGTCSEFTKLYKQAKAEVNAARNVIQNSKSVKDLHIVHDRLQTAIVQLREIPKNAKSYQDMQKTLSAGEKDLTAIKARLAKETQAQGLLNKAEEIATNATKQSKTAKSIQELEKVKAAWQQALEKLKTIPSGSLIADTAKARAQEYNGKVKQIEGRIKELVAEAQRREQIKATARNYSSQPFYKSLNSGSTFNSSRPPSYRASDFGSTFNRSHQPSYQQSSPQQRTSPPQKLTPLWGNGSLPSRSKPSSSDAPPLW